MRYAEAEATYRSLRKKSDAPPVLSRLASLVELKGDPDEALRLMGVSPIKVKALAFGLATATAAIAGALSSTTAFFWAWANITGHLPEPAAEGVERREVEVHGEPTI